MTGGAFPIASILFTVLSFTGGASLIVDFLFTGLFDLVNVFLILSIILLPIRVMANKGNTRVHCLTTMQKMISTHFLFSALLNWLVNRLHLCSLFGNQELISSHMTFSYTCTLSFSGEYPVSLEYPISGGYPVFLVSVGGEHPVFLEYPIFGGYPVL